MPQKRWLQTGSILGLILVAAWLRLWQLPQLPPGFWRDEAYNAMDALWMWQQAAPQPFLIGNTGREPLLHYLGALAMAGLGATPYTFRLVGALTGLLTVPLLYRWLTSLFAGQPQRRWLALLASIGLTVSLWHVTMSRSGYRTVLVPLFFIAMSHLFWLAWQRGSMRLFAAAGLLLGLSQYTYLSARLLPLVFGLFALLWLLLSRRPPNVTKSSLPAGGEVLAPPSVRGRLGICVNLRRMLRRKSPPGPPKGGEKPKIPPFGGLGGPKSVPATTLWRGLAITAAVSLLVFLPLALFFWQQPSAFVSRSADMSLFNQAEQTGLPLSTVVLSRLADALRVFYDGGIDPSWRHTLVGAAGFDWLMRLGFWLGLGVALKNYRQPRYLWLLTSLLVLWLPALLAQVGTLRLSAFLIPYYALMAVGWVTVGQWLANRLSGPIRTGWSYALIAGLLLLVSGGLTGYNYFVRWASEPAVYRYFNGQVVDLSQHLIDRSRSHDLLLPFEVYTHPTVRFLLANQFSEVAEPPAPDPSRPAILVNVPDMVDLPASASTYAYVWLTRQGGHGRAYTLAPFLPADFERLQRSGESVPFYNPRSGRLFANLIPLTSAAPFVAATDRPPARPTRYTWGDELRLVGYDVQPGRVAPGQSPLLNLYWKNLTGQPAPYNTFVQLIDAQGRAIAQWTDGYLSDQHRWREGLITPTQHRLWLDPQIEPGAYLVRLGLFDPTSRRRLPLVDAAGRPAGDQVQLGLFYVGDTCTDPTPAPATFGQPSGDEIRLLGYEMLSLADPTALTVCLWWQADRFIKHDYTVFVQLLDAAGSRVAGWDSPPLAGSYPTSAWSPGEQVIDRLAIPLPDELPPGRYRLVTGLYNFDTGQRLPVTVDGQPQPGDMVVLRETELP